MKKGRVARATDKAAIELVGVGGVSGYEITSKAIRVMNSGRCSLLIEWLFNFSFTSQQVTVLLSCCFKEPPKLSVGFLTTTHRTVNHERPCDPLFIETSQSMTQIATRVAIPLFEPIP